MRADADAPRSINPATEELVDRASTWPTVDGDRRRDRARPHAAFAGLARGRARPTAAGCCAGSPTLVDDAHRGAGPARGAQLRPHRSATPAGRRATSATCLNYYAGRAGAAVRPADPGGRRHRRHLPRAARRRRRHRAVELPDADRRLGLRAGARRRQHRRAQAGRAHPADRDPARRAGAGGRPARGRASPCSRARARSSGERFVTHPLVRKVVLHRLDRGRQADHGRLRRPGEAGDPRARRQERQHRLRRRRPRAGRGHARRTPSSTTPARTAAPARRILVERAVYDGFLELLEPAVHGRQGAWTRRRGQPRWGR